MASRLYASRREASARMNAPCVGGSASPPSTVFPARGVSDGNDPQKRNGTGASIYWHILEGRGAYPTFCRINHRNR
jgi:hypothetical protein